MLLDNGVAVKKLAKDSPFVVLLQPAQFHLQVGCPFGGFDLQSLDVGWQTQILVEVSFIHNQVGNTQSAQRSPRHHAACQGAAPAAVASARSLFPAF